MQVMVSGDALPDDPSAADKRSCSSRVQSMAQQWSAQAVATTHHAGDGQC
jgi:hypothetical protein